MLDRARILVLKGGMTDIAAPAKAPRSRRIRTEITGWLTAGLIVYGLHGFVAKPFYIPSESMMPGLLVGDHLLVGKFPYGWSYVSPGLIRLPFLHGRLLGRLPDRGDVVVFTPPGEGRRGEDWIKRVIGLPGDSVAMRGGRLWLNGKPVETVDLGARLIPIDGNFHCDAADPDPERAFPGYAGARVTGRDGKPVCRLHVLRETLPNGTSYETLDFGTTGADDFPDYTVPAGRIFVMGDNRDDSADSRIPTVLGGLGGAIPVENIGGRAEFLTYSLDGNATWNPLTWFGAFRGGRSGTPLWPERRVVIETK